MLISKEWCSPLYCCTGSSGATALSFFSLLVLSSIRACDSRKQIASPNVRVELALAANVVVSGRVVS